MTTISRPRVLALLTLAAVLTLGTASAEAGWGRCRRVRVNPQRVVHTQVATVPSPVASSAFSSAHAAPGFSQAASGAFQMGPQGHSSAMSSAASNPFGSNAFSSAFSGGPTGSSSAFSSSFNIGGMSASYSNSMTIGPGGVSHSGSNAVSFRRR